MSGPGKQLGVCFEYTAGMMMYFAMEMILRQTGPLGWRNIDGNVR